MKKLIGLILELGSSRHIIQTSEIEDELYKKLTKYCDKNGVKESVAIRRALICLLTPESEADA